MTPREIAREQARALFAEVFPRRRIIGWSKSQLASQRYFARVKASGQPLCCHCRIRLVVADGLCGRQMCRVLHEKQTEVRA